MSCMEVSGAMHLVGEIPAEDQKKLTMIARYAVRQSLDVMELLQLARNAYKVGRETEAKRHQCFVIGTLEDVEGITIRRALESCDFNPMRAAKLLNIGKSTMYRKMQYFGIEYGQKTDHQELPEPTGTDAGLAGCARD